MSVLLKIYMLYSHVDTPDTGGLLVSSYAHFRSAAVNTDIGTRNSGT